MVIEDYGIIWYVLVFCCMLMEWIDIFLIVFVSGFMVIKLLVFILFLNWIKMLVIIFFIRVCELKEIVRFNVFVLVSNGVILMLIFDNMIMMVMVLIIIVSVLWNSVSSVCVWVLGSGWLWILEVRWFLIRLVRIVYFMVEKNKINVIWMRILIIFFFVL